MKLVCRDAGKGELRIYLILGNPHYAQKNAPKVVAKCIYNVIFAKFNLL